MPARIATQTALHALFHPRAVAVIGASDDTTKHGYIVLTNLRETGFRGGIYGISRRLPNVDGIPCFPDLASLPEPVDTAFLAVPAEAAVQAVRDCARAGLKAVIVGSAGYAESLDARGEQRQRELRQIAREEGIRIVGPNCNGVYNAHLPLSVGFNTSHAKRQMPGGISIFSHSGALFDAMAGRLAMLGAGLSLFASAGNEADMSVLDYMEYGIGHPPTRVIALLIDSLDDGPRFRRLALAAHAAGKHVVALKIGGSEAGAAAAVAHSSRLAGDDASYRALFVISGVATVKTLEGLMTAAALLDKYGSCPGKLGSLSTSGAGASLIADRCDALSVPLATLTPQTHAAIDAQKVGLVHVGLRDPDAVVRACAAVGCPRVILQPMIRGDLEAIAGISRADGVGLVLIAGLGGIFAEALHDVVPFPLPVSRAFVDADLAKSSLGRVLASPRWKHPAAHGAFVDLLMSLQEAALSAGDALQAIDINPVILGEAGAIAVDALVVPSG